MLHALQASVVLSTAGKYTLSMIDAAMEGRWAGKGTYVFYLELVTDMLHLFVYLIFFIIVFANYGLPLHLVRWSPPASIVMHCVLCCCMLCLMHSRQSGVYVCIRLGCRCVTCTGRSATSATGSLTSCATAASPPTWMSGAGQFACGCMGSMASAAAPLCSPRDSC
jgi:hypothetical protein